MAARHAKGLSVAIAERLCVALRDGRLSSVVNKLISARIAGLPSHSQLHGPARQTRRALGCGIPPYHDLLPWLLACALFHLGPMSTWLRSAPAPPCPGVRRTHGMSRDCLPNLSLSLNTSTGIQRDEHLGPSPCPVQPTGSRPSICEMRECIPSSPRRWERKCHRPSMLCAKVAEITPSALLLLH